MRGSYNLHSYTIVLNQGVNYLQKKFLLFFAYVLTKSWAQVFAIIRGSACQEIGSDRLLIRWPGLFGLKGTVIAVPRDNEIYTRFQKYASWCPSVSLFLSKSFRKKGRLLLDLGAHAGLISLQTQKFSSNSRNQIICLEPIPRHIDSLRFNMSQLNCQIIERVLSFDKADVTFYIDKINFGNSSSFFNIVGSENSHKLVLPSITAPEIENILGSAPIVLKSDLQGFDAYGLSLFSENFWNRVERGVVEVLASAEIEKDYVILTCARVGKFKNISWSPFGRSRITELELLHFWISKTGEERDVYFWN